MLSTVPEGCCGAAGGLPESGCLRLSFPYLLCAEGEGKDYRNSRPGVNPLKARSFLTLHPPPGRFRPHTFPEISGG